MKKSSGGLQYVKDFSFPSDQGFTGSAGKSEVKGYMRGGKVSSTHEPTKRNVDHTKGKGRSKKGMPGANRKRASRGVKAKGGVVKKQMGGMMDSQKMGYQGDDDKQIDVGTIGVTVRAKGGRAVGKGGARQRMPKNVKARGGRAKSTHDKLMDHGKQMGYKQGGYVAAKDTSAEFKATRGKQDTMDTGNQPARRGGNARSQQDRESGGTGRLRPGLKKGGRVQTSNRDRARKMESKAPANRSGRANKEKAKAKPRTAAAKGGVMKKAKGGLAKAAGDKRTHPTGKGRKPFTGYNEQPAGHGAPSARYLGKRGAARSR